MSDSRGEYNFEEEKSQLKVKVKASEKQLMETINDENSSRADKNKAYMLIDSLSGFKKRIKIATDQEDLKSIANDYEKIVKDSNQLIQANTEVPHDYSRSARNESALRKIQDLKRDNQVRQQKQRIREEKQLSDQIDAAEKQYQIFNQELARDISINQSNEYIQSIQVNMYAYSNIINDENRDARQKKSMILESLKNNLNKNSTPEELNRLNDNLKQWQAEVDQENIQAIENMIAEIEDLRQSANDENIRIELQNHTEYLAYVRDELSGKIGEIKSVQESFMNNLNAINVDISNLTVDRGIAELKDLIDEANESNNKKLKEQIPEIKERLSELEDLSDKVIGLETRRMVNNNLAVLKDNFSLMSNQTQTTESLVGSSDSRQELNFEKEKSRLKSQIKSLNDKLTEDVNNETLTYKNKDKDKVYGLLMSLPELKDKLKRAIDEDDLKSIANDYEKIVEQSNQIKPDIEEPAVRARDYSGSARNESALRKNQEIERDNQTRLEQRRIREENKLSDQLDEASKQYQIYNQDLSNDLVASARESVKSIQVNMYAFRNIMDDISLIKSQKWYRDLNILDEKLSGNGPFDPKLISQVNDKLKNIQADVDHENIQAINNMINEFENLDQSSNNENFRDEIAGHIDYLTSVREYLNENMGLAKPVQESVMNNLNAIIADISNLTVDRGIAELNDLIEESEKFHDMTNDINFRNALHDQVNEMNERLRELEDIENNSDQILNAETRNVVNDNLSILKNKVNYTIEINDNLKEVDNLIVDANKLSDDSTVELLKQIKIEFSGYSDSVLTAESRNNLKYSLQEIRSDIAKMSIENMATTADSLKQKIISSGGELDSQLNVLNIIEKEAEKEYVKTLSGDYIPNKKYIADLENRLNQVSKSVDELLSSKQEIITPDTSLENNLPDIDLDISKTDMVNRITDLTSQASDLIGKSRGESAKEVLSKHISDLDKIKNDISSVDNKNQTLSEFDKRVNEISIKISNISVSLNKVWNSPEYSLASTMKTNTLFDTPKQRSQSKEKKSHREQRQAM